MKIAICFYGYYGKINISRNFRNQLLYEYTLDDYNEMWSINHFKKYVIQNYDIDIIFHTWETDNETLQILFDNYKPKKYLIEKQELIKNDIINSYKNLSPIEITVKSQLYTQSKSIDLVLEYQKENNFEYDLVLHTPFDQLFFKPIEFDKLDKNYIYNSYWNCVTPLVKNNMHYENNKGLYDQWYISNPNNIKLLFDKDSINFMYKKYPYLKYGAHIQRQKLIEEINLIDKLRFYLYVGIDHIKCNQIFTPQYRNLLKECLN